MVRGFCCLSLWTKDRQVVPEMNALMVSTSPALGRSLHCSEKR